MQVTQRPSWKHVQQNPVVPIREPGDYDLAGLRVEAMLVDRTGVLIFSQLAGGFSTSFIKDAGIIEQQIVYVADDKTETDAGFSIFAIGREGTPPGTISQVKKRVPIADRDPDKEPKKKGAKS